MDDVLETIHIALTCATSLLRRISSGNTRLVYALKIMEAAIDVINTLTIYMTLLLLIMALIRDIHPLQEEEGKLFQKRPLSRLPKLFYRYA